MLFKDILQNHFLLIHQNLTLEFMYYLQVQNHLEFIYIMKD